MFSKRSAYELYSGHTVEQMTERRRQYGTGSVTFTAGKFLARLPGRARAVLGRFATEQEAHAALDAALGLAEPRRTVGDYLKAFMVARENSGRVRDIEREWISVRKWILPFPIAAMALEEVTRRHAQAWVDEIRKTLSEQSVRHARRILSQMFKEAVAERLIPSNPCDDIRIKAAENGKVITPYLLPDEIETLLSPESGLTDEQRAVFTLAICTGLRQGEIFGLRRGAVHLDAKYPYLDVKHSWDRAPKNGRADQRVYLIPLVVPVLREWLASHDDDYVFPLPGSRMKYRRYDAGWARVRDRLGLNPGVTFHGLRKTAGTALLSGWLGPKVSPLIVSKTLRHATLKQTLDTYAFLLEEDLAQALNETNPEGSGNACNIGTTLVQPVQEEEGEN